MLERRGALLSGDLCNIHSASLYYYGLIGDSHDVPSILRGTVITLTLSAFYVCNCSFTYIKQHCSMFNVQISYPASKLTESDLNAPLHVQQTLDPDSPSSLVATAKDNGIDMIVRVLRFGFCRSIISTPKKPGSVEVHTREKAARQQENTERKVHVSIRRHN